MYVCMYVRRARKKKAWEHMDKYVCMCVLYICIYICMYVCMYACMYVCMYVRMYVCVYVNTYVCVYISIFNQYIIPATNPNKEGLEQHMSI